MSNEVTPAKTYMKTVIITRIKKIFGVAFFLMILCLIANMKFDVVSQGDGVISMDNSDMNIFSPSSGIIKEIYVTRGDRVQAGQKLLVITNVEDENKRDLLKYNSEIYNEDIKRLSGEIEAFNEIIASGVYDGDYNQAMTTQIKKIKVKYDIYQQRKNDFKTKKANIELKLKSLSAQKKLLEQKSSMISESIGKTLRLLDSNLEKEKIHQQMVESELQIQEVSDVMKSAYNDFIQLTLDLSVQAEMDLRKNKDLLATSQSELNTINNRIHSTDIDSKIHGTVLSLKIGLSPGVFVERNSELMVLKRTDEGGYIEGNFDSKFRPFIQNGSVVKVRINAPGMMGYYYGKIIGISSDSFKYEDYSKQHERYYKVKVKFDEKILNYKKLSNMIGIKTSLFVVNDQVSLFEYLVSVFNKDLDFSVW